MRIAPKILLQNSSCAGLTHTFRYNGYSDEDDDDDDDDDDAVNDV